MNWRKGLLRSWLVLSIVWVVAAVVLERPIQAWRDPIIESGRPSAVNEARAEGYKDAEIAAYLRRQYAITFTEHLIVPPFALLAIGCGVFWAMRGFRLKKSN